MSGAFADAAGISAANVALLAAGIGSTVVLLWAAWALLSAWYGWARTRVSSDQFQRAAVRIVLLCVVLLWILV